MRRQGTSAATVAGILALVIVGAMGAIMIEGSTQTSGSQGGAGNLIGNLQNGIRAITGGLTEMQTGTIGLIAEQFQGNSTAPLVCGLTTRNSFIQIINSGPTSGTVEGVSITYGGSTSSFSVTGPCVVGPSGSPTAITYILFKGPNLLGNSPPPQDGLPFVGSVSLTNGAHLPFSGKWYSGSPQVAATLVNLYAADFKAGQPTNSTCSDRVGTRSFIALNNSGTEPATPKYVTILSGNSTTTIPVAGACNIGPDGTPSALTYVMFGPGSELGAAVKQGQSFNGTVSLSNRTTVPFTGMFQ